jgi:hypothetical protein
MDKRRTKFLTATILFIFLTFGQGRSLRAAQMFAFDLESLAHMSTAVIEGEIVSAKTVNWVDVLTVKVSRTYAGDAHVGQECVVGLSAYAKKKGDFNYEAFGVGDHLILFIEPVTQEQWKKDGIPYWPVSSGVKVISGGKVTGMLQESNPGSYLNIVDEGEPKAFRDKLEAAVKWAATFRKELAAKKDDPAWLLSRLSERPVRPIESWGRRDEIAVTLCAALAATHDKEAIDRALKSRTDRYEKEVLGWRPT